MRFLFVDRILQLESSEGSIRGIKRITHEDPYLYEDEDQQSCFMSALIGETLGQLTAWQVMMKTDFSLRPVAGIVAETSVYRSAYVGETLELESWVDQLDEAKVAYHGEVRIAGELIFKLEGALGPMLPMEDFIDPAVARRQFAEINRPGEWPIPSKSTLHALPLLKNPRVNLHFDSITAHEPGVQLSAVKRITRAAPYFPDHFPHKPVLPLTVLLECKMNLVKEFLKHANFNQTYQIQTLKKIKMIDFVAPGDEVHTDLQVRQQDDQNLILRLNSFVAEKRICTLDMILIRSES